MDQKLVPATVDLAVEKNGGSYVFSMPVGAPFGEAYDVAFEVLSKIVELSKNAAEKMKRKEEEVKEEDVEVVTK